MRITIYSIQFDRYFVRLLKTFVGALCMLASACSSPKNVTYFRDIPDTIKKKEINQIPYSTPVIQPDDILQVSIQTLDPAATALLNQQNAATWPDNPGSNPSQGNKAGGSSGLISGYLVDKGGYVNLPLIGKVQVSGKTTGDVGDEIQKKAAQYYKDPIVNVRFANFKITVLGEVARPSSYVMPNEKVTLLDALGIAGDLTIYGRRDNVLLIRDKNGKKEFVRFDLNKSDVFRSPYYYLQQGDVVYVEPNNAKVASTDLAKVRTVTIMASILSLVVVLATRIHF